MKHIKKINELFMSDGFVAYRIPDDKRDEYFNFVDQLIAAAPRASETIDAYNDPIVIFNDITLFSAKNQEAIKNFMQRIGAKDVTQMYVTE